MVSHDIKTGQCYLPKPKVEVWIILDIMLILVQYVIVKCFYNCIPFFFCTDLALSILQIEPDTNLAIHSSIFLYKVSNQNVQGEIMSISYKNNNLIKVTTAKYIILLS